ncbi:hypothetical protein J4732_18345 [Serratia marcescens]|uniref:Gamma-glutamylputrescine synthetase PuuA n=1 Tax=Serratia marcescens TaxID=615 RepID=A0A939STQ0_SERMA|nr:hypothetical protein [Serratia marcescens]
MPAPTLSGDGDILAGIVYGFESALPPEPVTGNGLEQDGLPFPIRQSDALYEFEHQPVLNALLGERFSHVYGLQNTDELVQFERLITETEIEWMLKNA